MFRKSHRTLGGCPAGFALISQPSPAGTQAACGTCGRVCVPACVPACVCVPVCVRVCLRARVPACLSACPRACACLCACPRACACLRACLRVCVPHRPEENGYRDRRSRACDSPLEVPCEWQSRRGPRGVCRGAVPACICHPVDGRTGRGYSASGPASWE